MLLVQKHNKNEKNKERKEIEKKEIKLFIIGVDVLQLGFVHTAAKYIMNNLLLHTSFCFIKTF